jgi:hypothetical protein
MTLREGGLRKRGYLKSPVRENRTPGSVGGQPGNWLSYPDDVLVVPHALLTLPVVQDGGPATSD